MSSDTAMKSAGSVLAAVLLPESALPQDLPTTNFNFLPLGPD